MGNSLSGNRPKKYLSLKGGEFKHEVRQFQKSYDNQQAKPNFLKEFFACLF